MNSHLHIMLLLVAMNQFAHGQVFCIPGQEYSYPEMASSNGVEGSFQVRFDVVEFAPRNIEISALDKLSSNWSHLFEQSITNNLKNFTYTTDTLGFQLTLKYVLFNKSRLNTSFTQRVSDTEVHFVGRQGLASFTVDSGVFTPDLTIDSAYVTGEVPFKSGTGRKADILVERIFIGDPDSTVVLRNNYPELLDEILSAASGYQTNHFRSLAPNATHFFIRFRVRREVCGFTQIF